MAKNANINVIFFGKEIGKIGFDENNLKSFFQYNPSFLNSGDFSNLFPLTGIIKRIEQVQVFSQFNNETFKGLPPQFADSLPDMFGNIIFKQWLATNNKNFEQISVLEQLTYVANRGMGALEYQPAKQLAKSSSINLTKITEILQEVLYSKKTLKEEKLNTETLYNIFKIGTSAGGARPKILVAENKKTGIIEAGDLHFGEEYKHYLVKLNIDSDVQSYEAEKIEYCYYKTAISIGINMMHSKLIDDKHFATLRFDRQKGKKQHILTASGITGWDFRKQQFSSYENLFQLCVFLKITHAEIEELFKRMVFNIVYNNTDDHLKNHSFIYNEEKDAWHLSPAYDITYALNPLLDFKKTSRALSVNGKRTDIFLKDVLKIADLFTIKNAKSVVKQVENASSLLVKNMQEQNIPETIIKSIQKRFVLLSSKN